MRSTDRLIALQFLAVAVPIAFVLLAQMVADGRRAAALEASRPLRTLANDARADYRTFTNGAADAVDTGALGRQSAEALKHSAERLAELAARGAGGNLGDTPAQVADLATRVQSGATLDRLMALRGEIAAGDRATRAIDESFERSDAAVVRDAVESARVQKQRVTLALFISLILTVFFVLATRLRLKRQIEADAAIERRRRAELETISIRFGMATRAARAGVYEVQESDGSVWWSDTMHELYGQSTDSFTPTLSGWLALVYPADRAGAEAAMTRAMRERRPLHSHYRVVRPDGSLSHIESVGAVVSDSADGGARLVGIELDVTERVAAARREETLQAQLRDASRQAGMADVATSVLHNVGNVLNSVNVSANLVTDSIKRSRAPGLERVVSLLKEHESDLGTFVAQDQRGRVLPVYLAELARHLNADNQSALRELDSLKSNIDHIKDIVTMQQRYAKLGGLAELIDVRHLVEESVRINCNALERHAVRLVREFGEVPEIVVDKHKVLQILVNLLRNAKDACQGMTDREKVVRIRIEKCAIGVRLSIADNGAGITRENMERIFIHGFTTKKSGHGFGLHSGALAAKEMGGVLRAESAGPGHGATFVLELPLKPPESSHD
ncbi:MAG TPA: ATP-binding protein [Steroidobacteraceae bacterium]|nr:ATP-binding protein [Steroidobacteraceae bacterium]